MCSPCLLLLLITRQGKEREKFLLDVCNEREIEQELFNSKLHFRVSFTFLKRERDHLPWEGSVRSKTKVRRKKEIFDLHLLFLLPTSRQEKRDFYRVIFSHPMSHLFSPFLMTNKTVVNKLFLNQKE